MSVARLIAETLYRVGVRRIYGIIGTSIVDFIDELYNYRDKIDFVTTRHEQVAAAAADAEYRASRRLAAVAVHAGPGFLNSLISLGVSYKDRIPLIMITGGVRRRLRGTGAWLEVDQEALAKPLSASYVRIERPSEAGEALLDSLRALKGYPKGPIVVDVAEDIWRSEVSIDEDYFKNVEDTVKPVLSSVDRDIVGSIIGRALESEKPVIMATGELNYNPLYNPERLLELASRMGAYIVTSGNGRGACPENHELCLGRVGFGGGSIAADRALEASDFTLVLGNEFDDITTYAYNLLPQGDIIVASLDPVVEERPQYYEHFKVDPLSLLEALVEEMKGRATRDRGGWRGEVNGYRKEWEAMLAEARRRKTKHANPSRFFSELDALLARNRVITGGQGTHILYTYNNMRVYEPGGFLAATNLGAMGYAFPAALGAKLAKPDADVVAVVGDGEIMMTVQDLETMVRENIPAKIIVVNDNSYRVLYLRQVIQKQGRVYETILGNPDFTALAQAFGIPAVRVDGDDYSKAFQLIRSHGPALIELVIDRDDIPPLNMDYTLRMSM